MATLRAYIDPFYALKRVRHYGAGRVVIDFAKRYPAVLPLTFGMLRGAKIARDPIGYVRRRRLAKQIVKGSAFKGYFPPREAFRIAPPGTFDGVDKLIPEARKLYQKFLSVYPSGRIDKTNYSYILFDYSKPQSEHLRVDLRTHPAFQDLAMYRPFVEIACDYLGEVPIVGQITYQVVAPNEDIEGFQKFHIDGGGNGARQVKIFIAVEDVDEGNGATMIISADKSEQIARSINYRAGRIPDEVVFSPLWKGEIKNAEGPAGSTFLFDTCRAIHAGARTRTRPRLLIMLQYMSKYIAGETSLQRELFDFDKERAAADPIGRLLFDVA